MTKHEAEAAVQRILHDLERATGRVVLSIELQTVDVSARGKEQHARAVSISLMPKPGEDWAV